MRATTATDRKAVVTSWVVAALVALGCVLAIWLMPTPENRSLSQAEEPKAAKRAKKEDDSKKKRALPEDHLRKMIESSEVLVKMELRQRLKLFEEIAQNVAKKKTNLLNQVQSRKVPDGSPADINNTATAKASPHLAAPRLPSNASVQDLYDRLAVHETGILNDHLASVAAATTSGRLGRRGK